MQLSVYVVVAIFGSRCSENFVLSTAAHGSAIQNVWCSTQRSRSFALSFTTICVLTVHCLHFFPWFLHWHSGFGDLAGSHLSCLTDRTCPQIPPIQLCIWPFRVYTTRCTCYAVSSSDFTDSCWFLLFIFSGLLLCNLIQICLILYIVCHQRSHDH